MLTLITMFHWILTSAMCTSALYPWLTDFGNSTQAG